MRLSKRAWLTMTLLMLVAYLASANAQVPKQGPRHRKNSSGCTSPPGRYYFNGGCAFGSGGCYYCEHTDRDGTYGCYEAPDPADGISCTALDYQSF
jgi:hypothetical protein